MQPGQPLDIAALLPFGLSPDDFLIIALGLGIFLVLWSIGSYFLERDRFAPRLRMIQDRRAELKSEALAAPSRRKKAQENARLTLIRRVVSHVNVLKQNQIGGIQKKLTAAGYRSKDAITMFAFAKLVSPFAGLLIGLILAKMDWSHAFSSAMIKPWLKIIFCMFALYKLPELLVSNAKAKRQKQVRKALPDALDLMMICAEAGLSLAAALDRVSRELSRMSPILAEEFSLTSVELGFLPDRATALKNLAERTLLPEVRGFVNVIVQTEKYGTPIAQALRVLSKEFRMQRMLRAEQKAARLPAMMTVPMIVFILPALFIVVMAPAIIGVMGTM